MADMQDILMDAIVATLSEKIDPKLLKRANTQAMRRKLFRRLTNEVFYKLLKEERLNLCPGFGTVLLKEIREKDKKVYDRKTGKMVSKHVRGRKVVYKPGDSLREFL